MDRLTFAHELEVIVGTGNVLWRDYDLMLYEYDGSIDKARPEAVVFPSTAQQVAELVRLCGREEKAFTARGAGTGLSGGAVPVCAPFVGILVIVPIRTSTSGIVEGSPRRTPVY